MAKLQAVYTCTVQGKVTSGFVSQDVQPTACCKERNSLSVLITGNIVTMGYGTTGLPDRFPKRSFHLDYPEGNNSS